ncbi:terminase [Lampropedia aestuarii]|uniref:terminase n=1 Tax=Lampropedia aestuarii TaxID=2562762 RepID=UPI001981DB7E|nr:terminase [Lampropedia aestuarii]
MAKRIDPSKLSDAEALELYRDPAWRLSHLYKIVAKGDGEGGEGSLVVTFKPNRAQRRLLARLHSRNVILKARQLGFSTLVCILWLDTALFSEDPMACAIVAQDRDTAGKLFAKVIFAYDRLPDALKAQFPIVKRTAEEVQFGHNGASVRVATSARGGTIHRLHVSEMGKIGAKYPQKAKEIVTGSIPAVPLTGIVIVESTAEGESGRYYEMVKAAGELQASGRPLTARDYRLHFFAWWEQPEYRMDPDGVLLTQEDEQYFRDVEGRCGIALEASQKAWYVATLRSADIAGERPLMWQEYPSYADEPFKVPQEGCYYSVQLMAARREGRVLPILPIEPGVPVNSFWDIGSNDNTVIWLHQQVGPEDRFVRFHKSSGEPPAHYAKWLQEQGVVFGAHYLPHDAEQKRQGTDPQRNKSFREMMEELMPGQRFETVDRIPRVLDGIQSTRIALASCWFDEAHCSEGLKDLGTYRKEWDERRGTWKDTPFHGPDSDAADAFRQFAQAKAMGMIKGFVGSASGGYVRRAKPGVLRRRGGPMSV